MQSTVSLDSTARADARHFLEDLSFSKLFKNTELTSKILTEKLSLENFEKASRVHPTSKSTNDKYCKSCSRTKSDLKLW